MKRLLLILAFAPLLSAQTYVDGRTASDNTSTNHTTFSTSSGLNVPSGALLFACATSTSTGTYTITDTGSANTFTALLKQTRNGGGYFTQCFYAKNTVAVSGDIFTANWSSAGNFVIINVALISGADTVSPLDQNFGCGACGASSGAITSNTFTTTSANEISIALAPANDTGPATAGSGYTIQNNSSVPWGSGSLYLETQNFTSIQTSVTATYNWSVASGWLITGATFKAVAASPMVKRRNAGMIMR